MGCWRRKRRRNGRGADRLWRRELRLAHLPDVLAHWDIPPVTSIAAVHAGHRVFKITTIGPTFILKDISDAPDLSRLEFTRSVLAHVARTGLRVPIPLLSRSAQTAVPFQERFYLLSHFIEAGGCPSDPKLQAELFYHTGQAIAKLHQALASYPDKQVNRKTWREDIAGRVDEWISALGDGLPEPQATVVKRVSLERGTALKAALYGLPEQLIHRDCHPGNILVQGTHVIGFVDCDHLCIGPRFFDLAYYAVHHLKWVTDNEAATDRWLTNLPHLLAGYRSQQRLSQEEAMAIPYGMTAYHLLLSHWFMGLPQRESIAREIRALDWIHTHFDAIASATMSS
ncbi:MAG: phosphotransferase [Roseiflexaceae bacterium]|nr:phosphotransferase [Roseiflexaceae bacterium]